jgi:hypothetical protein
MARQLLLPPPDRPQWGSSPLERIYPLLVALDREHQKGKQHEDESKHTEAPPAHSQK